MASLTYVRLMQTVFSILAFVGLAGVLVSFLLGMFSMSRGGDFNAKYGNKLMWARVFCQALAVAGIVGAILSRGGSIG